MLVVIIMGALLLNCRFVNTTYLTIPGPLVSGARQPWLWKTENFHSPSLLMWVFNILNNICLQKIRIELVQALYWLSLCIHYTIKTCYFVLGSLYEIDVKSILSIHSVLRFCFCNLQLMTVPTDTKYLYNFQFGDCGGDNITVIWYY